jgi:hypothetical protein
MILRARREIIESSSSARCISRWDFGHRNRAVIPERALSAEMRVVIGHCPRVRVPVFTDHQGQGLAMRKRKAPVRSKKALNKPPKKPTEEKSRSVRKPTDLRSNSWYEKASASVAITIDRRR